RTQDSVNAAVKVQCFSLYLCVVPHCCFSFCFSASGASVVAIDNKIEQAMDLVKSHLMYAVREEVEVLKEQIKELYERNSVLERENAVLKSLANNDQLSQLSSPASNPTNRHALAPLNPPVPPDPDGFVHRFLFFQVGMGITKL
uniref:TSC22 domain family member 2 n=1 Tax=Astyanax mexicanus TaxID=7994 RepID=A0A3B1JRA5_ASTMX